MRNRRAGALCIAIAALGGCGSSAASRTAAGGDAGAAPSASERATAAANEINLQPRDLPSFTATPHRAETVASRRFDARLARCAGGVKPEQAQLSAYSDNLQHGSGLTLIQASSEVTVMPKPSLVRRDLTAVVNPRGLDCLRRYLPQATTRTLPGRVVATKVSVLRPRAPGAIGSFGIRVAVTMSIAAQRIPFYIDLLGFGAGRVEVSLTTAAIARPFPPAGERVLFRLLLERALARSVGNPKL